MSSHSQHFHRHQAGCPSRQNSECSFTFNTALTSFMFIRGKTHLGQPEGDVSQGWQSFSRVTLRNHIHFLSVHPTGYSRRGAWQPAWFSPGECCVFHHYGQVTVLPLLQVGLRILDQQYFLTQSHTTFQSFFNLLKLRCE